MARCPLWEEGTIVRISCVCSGTVATSSGQALAAVWGCGESVASTVKIGISNGREPYLCWQLGWRAGTVQPAKPAGPVYAVREDI